MLQNHSRLEIKPKMTVTRMQPERGNSRKQDVGEHAQRPDVALRESRFFVEYLWRSEGQIRAIRRYHSATQLGGALRATKVAQFHVNAAGRHQKHVVRLDVEMTVTAPMKILESIENLI